MYDISSITKFCAEEMIGVVSVVVGFETSPVVPAALVVVVETIDPVEVLVAGVEVACWVEPVIEEVVADVACAELEATVLVDDVDEDEDEETGAAVVNTAPVVGTGAVQFTPVYVVLQVYPDGHELGVQSSSVATIGINVCRNPIPGTHP